MRFRKDRTILINSGMLSRYPTEQQRSNAMHVLALAKKTICHICGTFPAGEQAVAVINRHGMEGGKETADVFGICGPCVTGLSADEIIDKLNYTVEKKQQHEDKTANDRGYRLEKDILALLEKLKERHPSTVSYKSQPQIRLQTDHKRIPDFDLEVKFPHETVKYLIEAQDRKKSNADILHKIHYIRTKHRRKTFIFVYRNQISQALLEELKDEGVMVYSFDEFRKYLEKYNETLSTTDNISRVESPRDNAMLVDVSTPFQRCTQCSGNVGWGELRKVYLDLILKLFPGRTDIIVASCRQCGAEFFAREGGEKVTLIRFIEVAEDDDNVQMTIHNLED